MPRLFSDRVLAAALLAGGLAGGAQAQSLEEIAKQWAEYDAVERKTIVELQPYRAERRAADAATGVTVEFIDLNPKVNSWFLLTTTTDGRRSQTYHLENPEPRTRQVSLDEEGGLAIVVKDADGATRCAPWAGERTEIAAAVQTGIPFAPICEDKLFLRNRVNGYSSNLERTTDFLRDNVWGGDRLVNFVKNSLYRDKFAETSDVIGTGEDGTAIDGPPPARLRGDRPVINVNHAFTLEGTPQNRMTMGIWYPVAGLEGVFASTIQPGFIAEDIFRSGGAVNGLDGVEANAIDYFVAFDLGRYELGFSRGTDHPRVDWSPRPPNTVRTAGLPGPDGIGDVAPVVSLGMVPPDEIERTIGTFTAGYKREHGAFRWGPYATTNGGSHYGFLENGVLYSKLLPGLATLYVLKDGTVGMKTWDEFDIAMLPELQFARQNGVPVIEFDERAGKGVPGDLVNQWGAGNWSGSADAQLRTLRGGACIVETDETRFLVYAYFSTATPSAMARTFQAYGCSYGMLLDMNALEHTYLGLYVERNDEILVEHMVPGMAGIDRRDSRGNLAARFIAFPDNRDLFYVMRREDTE